MTKLCLSTASGEIHGLINTLSNNVEDNGFKHMKPEYKSEMEKLRKEDAKLMKVEYINRKGKHERLDKPYCRYAGDPISIYHLIPGYTYELPKGFVNEVNANRPKRRAGLLSLDGENVNRDGSPLEKDQDDEWIHRLVPAGF